MCICLSWPCDRCSTRHSGFHPFSNPRLMRPVLSRLSQCQWQSDGAKVAKRVDRSAAAKTWPLFHLLSIITQVKKGFIWLYGQMTENGFLNQAHLSEGALSVQPSSDCIVMKSLVGSWPVISVLWTYREVVRNYRVHCRSTGTKSNSCSSVDINAIACTTWQQDIFLYVACYFSQW